MLEVKTMREDFENFNDEDEEWLSELEISDTDLENELSDWHAAQARQLAETSYGQDGIPHQGRPGMLRAQPGPLASPAGPAAAGTVTAGTVTAGRGRQAPPRQFEEEPDDDFTTPIRTGGWPASGHPGEDRTQAIIDRGRRSVSRGSQAAVAQDHVRRGGRRRGDHRGVRADLQVEPRLAGPAWRPSRARSTTACQNPNVASEPGQVNFACGKTTSSILWVFALMTSGNNPGFTDAKTGRQGLEPITPDPGRRDRLVAEHAPPVQPAGPGGQPRGSGPGAQQHHRRGHPDRHQRQADGAARPGGQPRELR